MRCPGSADDDRLSGRALLIFDCDNREDKTNLERDRIVEVTTTEG